MTTATATPQRTRRSDLAYQVLHLGFTVAPILFGLDKFFNLMTDWTQFLPGFVTDVVSGAQHPKLRDWKGTIDVGTLLASGILS